MSEIEFKIVAKPFDWKDNLSEVALEDFSCYQKEMSYGASQTIGTALAKLQLMEEQGLYPDVLLDILERLEEELTPESDYTKSEDKKLVRHWNNCVDVCKEIVKEVGGMNEK